MAKVPLIGIDRLLLSPSSYLRALNTTTSHFKILELSLLAYYFFLTTFPFFYPTNLNQVFSFQFLMTFNYRDNTTAYISCLMEFTQRSSKTNFRKIFTSSLSCIDFQFSLSEEIVDVDELPCQLICNIGDLLQEPTEGSVGVCTGSFCDFGGTIGIKITVTNINE